MSSGSTLLVPLPTRRDTRRLARRLALCLRGGDLLVLSGPLGAGKTFLVRALAHRLGLPPREPVTSPTFTLLRELDTRPPIAHADLYRLTSESDVRGLGLAALREDGWLLVVEWGEPHIATLGGDALHLMLTRDPRSATLRATGPRSAEVLGVLQATPA